jgi:hypothetical protein
VPLRRPLPSPLLIEGAPTRCTEGFPKTLAPNAESRSLPLNLTELVRSSVLEFVGVLDLDLEQLSSSESSVLRLSSFLEDLESLASLAGPV